MPTLFAGTIAGDSGATLAGSEIFYAVCHFTSVGAPVRELEVGSPDHILRAGWVSFGDSLSVIGGSPISYWLPVWWLDFVSSFWTPNGSVVGTTPVGQNATLVRWHLQPGGSAELYVYGS